MFLMGVLSAVIVGPCVAAPLAGALLYIGQTHDVVLGGHGSVRDGHRHGRPSRRNASSRNISYSRPHTLSVARALKLSIISSPGQSAAMPPVFV